MPKKTVKKSTAPSKAKTKKVTNKPKKAVKSLRVQTHKTTKLPKAQKPIAIKSVPGHKSDQTTEALKDQILAELNTIIDPEIGAGIVDIGLIYNIQIVKSIVHIEMTLTSFGCPIGPWFVEQVRDATKRVPGVTEATVEIVYEPAWSPEKMKPEIREAVLGY